MVHKKIAVDMPIESIRKVLSTALQQHAFDCGFDWGKGEKEVYQPELNRVLVFNQETYSISWLGSNNPGYNYYNYDDALGWLIGCKMEAKRPKFKVGDYVTMSHWAVVYKVEKILPDGGVLVENPYGQCFNESMRTYKLDTEIKLATQEEITKALIARAIQLGLVEGAITDKTELIDTIVSETLLKERDLNKIETLRYNGIGKREEYRYDTEWDILYCLGWIIYIKGKWAKIAPNEIKVGEYKANFGIGNVAFGCKKYTRDEVNDLYDVCLTFGIQEIRLHNHLVPFLTIKAIKERF